MSMRLFWREIGEPMSALAEPRSLRQAIADAAHLRYLDGGGVGCMNEDERPKLTLKIQFNSPSLNKNCQQGNITLCMQGLWNIIKAWIF